MKRISLLLVFFGFLAINLALAQPTFTIAPPKIVTMTGQTVCVSVNVVDFTDIIATKFSIRWDSSVLSSPMVMGLNASVTGLDMGDIVVNAANGYLTFNWSNGLPCQTAQTGVTLPDGASLFQICFTANGQYGKHTPVKITNSPMDRYVTRINSNCNDIGEYVNDGFISIGTPPLTVNVSSVDGFTDDVVCVDFKVEDFNEIVSFQYSVQWDSNILQYQSATAVGLPNWLSPPSPQNVGTTQVSSGLLNLSWLTLQQQGVTMPDGTSILQVCFKIKGACGQSTPITIVPNPDGVIEVINATTDDPTNGTNIGLLAKEGTGTVSCFNPNGIALNVQDKAVCPGETFTVDVTLEDFQSIISLEFGLQWNPQIINLTNITYPQTPPCSGFAASVQNLGGNGQIKVDWGSGFSCTKPDGFVLMRLHFTATGGSGASTTIAVVNPIFVDKVNPPVENIGINNDNGLVSICELTGLSTVAGSTDAIPGEVVCIPFTVENFDDLTQMQYTIAWEPNVLEFFSVQDFNLQDLSIANFLTTQAADFGVLGVEWETGAGVTVPDGSEIFNVCFTVVGDPGTCSEISFQEVPWPVDIQTETSNGTNVGLVSQLGQVCVDNPLSFFTKIPDVFAAPGGQVCIEFTVENFLQLTNMDYTINWNSSILEFQSITAVDLPNFTASSYDASNASSEGILGINWASGNAIQGTTLPDGTSIFKLCFNVVGEGGECSPVVITDSPTFIDVTTATTGNANLGLTSDDGSVCVSASLHLVDFVITPVDCPSSPLGAIDITVSGGSGEYDFTWTGQGVSAGDEDQSGLTAGIFNLTVTDVQNPGITMEKEFEVGFSQNALLANAGQDTAFACGGFLLTLNGTASTGQNALYTWSSLTGNGLVLPGEENKSTPTVIGGTSYVLTLTDTLSGCNHKDTVFIASPVIPVPDAGDSVSITCLQDTVILDGTLSTFGYDVTWTTDASGEIVPGTEKTLEAQATKQGWYFLTLTNLASGCARTDSVFVTENKVIPTVAAAPGGDGSLGCTDTFEILDGAGSSTGSNIVYAWSPMDGGQICGDTSSLTMQACSPGTFQLLVTDTVNGCFSTATAEIVGDTLKPIAVAGDFQTITCEHLTATLDGSGSSGSANLSYEWTTTNGNITSPNPFQVSIEADKAGLYQLTVTNDDNGCSAVSEVTVISEQDNPDVAAAVSGKITCAITTVTLDGDGSSTGSEFFYEWTNEAGTDIGTAITVDVTEPGTYTLMVTNTQNGCTETASVEVEADNELPMANAGAPKTLTCILDEVQLQGSADVSGSDIIYQWVGPGLGCIVSGSTTLTPTVKCTGTYTLTVADTTTGCTGTSEVLVNDDMTAPTAVIGLPEKITCTTTEIDLQGSTDAANFSAEWTATPASLTIDNPTSLTPTVSAAGTYFLKITNDDNGCTANALVQVEADTLHPTADAGADAIIDCSTPLGSLSAANSTQTGTTLTWSAVAPATIAPGIIHDVTISVGVGTYSLTVKNDGNGCSDTDEAEVTNGSNTITAAAGADQNIGCLDQSATLDGSGSTQGAGITQVWTDAVGAIIGNGLTATVFAPGTYTLTVSDSNTGCTGSDEVVVTQNVDANGDATASFTSEPCSDEVTLTGNLPDGTTGVWTTANGAIFADPTAATTSVTNLHTGDNVFTWTLSLGNCINYSSATVTIDLSVSQSAPNANADVETLTPDLLGTLSLNALDNDVFGGGDVIFSLLADPASGSVTSTPDGEIVYTKEKCFIGTVEIPYSICSAECPDLCDTSNIKITVEADPSEKCDEVPNGVTPNGDGVNDELVFDVILSNPEKYPDNEIIIFNRWGDVVFQAKPYQNDWTGTNENGKDLPAGTYYYVLKLSVGDGEIIRGDVTILR